MPPLSTSFQVHLGREHSVSVPHLHTVYYTAVNTKHITNHHHHHHYKPLWTFPDYEQQSQYWWIFCIITCNLFSGNNKTTDWLFDWRCDFPFHCVAYLKPAATVTHELELSSYWLILTTTIQHRQCQSIINAVKLCLRNNNNIQLISNCHSRSMNTSMTRMEDHNYYKIRT